MLSFLLNKSVCLLWRSLKRSTIVVLQKITFAACNASPLVKFMWLSVIYLTNFFRNAPFHWPVNLTQRMTWMALLPFLQFMTPHMNCPILQLSTVFNHFDGIFNALPHFHVHALNAVPSYLCFAKFLICVSNDGQTPTSRRCSHIQVWWS